MPKNRQLGYAAIFGLVTTAAIAGLACIPHCDFFTFLLLPGALLAALPFPQGVEGDAPIVYLIAAGIIDILLYSLIAHFILRRWFWKPLMLSAIFVTLLVGCKSTPTPSTATTIATPTQTYPTRPTIPPSPFHLVHQTTDSLTLVTTETATDDQVTALLYQLHDAARTHTFATLHLPQSFIDHRDPIIFLHIYRGAKCASEKYTTAAYPCGPSYHAAADYTLGSFANKDRDAAILLHANQPPTEVWNPDAPNH